MSDTSEGMVEIIGSHKLADNSYLCEAIIRLNGEFSKLRFSVNETSYMLLKKMLSFQPFEDVTAGSYRYYFSGNYENPDGDKVAALMRIEQGQRHKQFKIELTRPLVANLSWLRLIKDKTEVAQLLI